MTDFKYIVENGCAVECNSCGCIAPLTTTENLRKIMSPEPLKLLSVDTATQKDLLDLTDPKEPESDEMLVCEVCYTTSISNVTSIPSSYGTQTVEIARITAESTNLLLDKLTSRQKELTKLFKPVKSGSKVPPCPHDEIIALYNESLPELTKVITSRWHGTQRAKDLETRWKESPAHQNIEFWRRFFFAIKARIPWYFPGHGTGAHVDWASDLGWLVKRSNFDKTLERLRVRHG